jgi:uncharacterized coiled-coil protein SlyX
MEAEIATLKKRIAELEVQNRTLNDTIISLSKRLGEANHAAAREARNSYQAQYDYLHVTKY